MPPNTCPNYDEAQQHLRLLDPTVKEFIFMVLPEQERDRRPITLPGTIAKHWPQIERLQTQGYGVFVAVNAMRGELRRKDQVIRVRAVTCDRDKQGKQLPLISSLRVCTSPGRGHEYLLVDPSDPLRRDEAEKINQKIAALYGGDRSATDSARCLRLAGTWNLKSEPFRASIIGGNRRRYTRAELLQAFPIDPIRSPSPRPWGEISSSSNIARFIEPLEFIPADDYGVWIDVGMALHFETRASPEGLQLWEQWSTGSNKYRPGVCSKKWESFNFTENGKTGGTIFYLAQQLGFSIDPTRCGRA